MIHIRNVFQKKDRRPRSGCGGRGLGRDDQLELTVPGVAPVVPCHRDEDAVTGFRVMDSIALQEFLELSGLTQGPDPPQQPVLETDGVSVPVLVHAGRLSALAVARVFDVDGMTEVDDALGEVDDARVSRELFLDDQGEQILRVDPLKVSGARFDLDPALACGVPGPGQVVGVAHEGLGVVCCVCAGV